MARLCWMVVVLAFFLYDSVAAKEQNNIDLGDTLNIPQDQDKNDLQQVSKDDPEGQVTQAPGLGGEEGTVLSTDTDTGEGMGEDIGQQITIGKGGGTRGGGKRRKGGKVKRKGGGKRKKGGKGKRKRGGKRRKGGKGKRKRGSKRRKGGKGKRKRGGKRRKGGKGKRRGKRSAEVNSESDE